MFHCTNQLDSTIIKELLGLIKDKSDKLNDNVRVKLFRLPNRQLIIIKNISRRLKMVFHFTLKDYKPLKSILYKKDTLTSLNLRPDFVEQYGFIYKENNTGSEIFNQCKEYFFNENLYPKITETKVKYSTNKLPLHEGHVFAGAILSVKPGLDKLTLTIDSKGSVADDVTIDISIPADTKLLERLLNISISPRPEIQPLPMYFVLNIRREYGFFKQNDFHNKFILQPL